MNKQDIQALQNVLKNFSEIILCLLYPYTCVLCGSLCDDGFCNRCKKEYPFIMGARCMCCSAPIKLSATEYCDACMGTKKAFHQGGSLWLHTGEIKRSVYRFKYHNHRIYARTYARLLVQMYQEKLMEWKPHCIIGVPIHKDRKKIRAYNQADVLGVEVCKEIKTQLEVYIPFEKNLTQRNKTTTFQKKLNNKERSLNIHSVFEVNTEIILPKKILIVDDIYTTGATLNELTKVLKKAGVEEVYFLTISIGQGS